MVKVKSTIIEGIDGEDKNKGKQKQDGAWEFKGKLKKSSFMITINTNKKKIPNELEEKFVQINNYLFEGNKILRYLTCARCAKGECKGTEQEAKCIEDVNLVCKLEYGPQNSKLHSHTGLSVVHSGVVRVDIDKIKKLCYRFFGYKLYISVKGSADVSFSREQYLIEKHGK